jgi:hypothetical protein
MASVIARECDARLLLVITSTGRVKFLNGTARFHTHLLTSLSTPADNAFPGLTIGEDSPVRVIDLFVDALALASRTYGNFETIVTPSGSCAYRVREHLDAIPQTPPVEKVRRSTYELVEFQHDVVKVDEFPWAEFPHKVGLHNACTTLRKLRTAKASEIDEPFFSKPFSCARCEASSS